MKIFTLTILILAVAINAEKKSFNGYKVYKVIPKTNYEVKILENINQAGIGETWNVIFRANDDVKMMVKPEMQPVFEGMMIQGNMHFKTVIEDVQKVIDDQLKPNIVARSSRFHSMDWDNYHNLETIERWMAELANSYSQVTTVSMGTSVEGRNITGIIINYDLTKNKPVAIIEGTLHAREWISTATVTWIVKELLTSTDADVRFMAENLEWHIFPVVNPDGYVYTWNTNRMWRKNRSKANAVSCAWLGADDDMSNGVDLNRNFDFFWRTVGASAEPCLNTFAGPYGGSEPETQAIVSYTLRLRPKNIVYYLSFHSYTQLFMVPYSHVSVHTEFPADNHEHLMEIANNSVAALRNRFGTNYRVGIAADVLYLMSGSSFDWVKYNANASVSYLIELRDMGDYGFLLPPDQIIPNNQEIMDAMIEMDKTTRRLGYYSSSCTAVLSVTLLISALALNFF